MSAKIIDGKELSARVRENLIARIKAAGQRPRGRDLRGEPGEDLRGGRHRLSAASPA